MNERKISRLAGSLLVVENDESLRSVMIDFLQEQVEQVIGAENGVTALTQLEMGRFHAVLCDIKMPIMDGFELLRRVRERSILIPFVFVTSYQDQETLLKALRLGAMDFLEKPFVTARLIEVARNATELGMALESIGLASAQRHRLTHSKIAAMNGS